MPDGCEREELASLLSLPPVAAPARRHRSREAGRAQSEYPGGQVTRGGAVICPGLAGLDRGTRVAGADAWWPGAARVVMFRGTGMEDAASRRVRGGDDRGAPGGPGPQGGAWPPGAAVTVAGGAEAALGPGDAPASVATGGRRSRRRWRSAPVR